MRVVFSVPPPPIIQSSLSPWFIQEETPVQRWPQLSEDRQGTEQREHHPNVDYSAHRRDMIPIRETIYHLSTAFRVGTMSVCLHCFCMRLLALNTRSYFFCFLQCTAYKRVYEVFISNMPSGCHSGNNCFLKPLSYSF